MTTALIGATTYRPTEEQLSHLLRSLTSLSQLGEAVLFDNTPVTDGDVSPSAIRARCQDAGITYAGSDRNVGTAGAMNHFLRECRMRGAEWMLYLDQDSRPARDFCQAVSDRLAAVPPLVAAIGSRIVLDSDAKPSAREKEPQRARYLISSGTAFRVGAALDVGAFSEVLGLDLVDHEMCLRLRSAGFQLELNPNWCIEHEIGTEGQRIPLIGIWIQRHPQWRRRMMWRNVSIIAREHFKTQPVRAARLWRLCGETA